MSRDKGARAYGPYKHGRKWRVVYREPGGGKNTESYDDEDFARAVVEKFNATTEAVTVSEAIDRYLKAMTRKGNKPRTIETAKGRLQPIVSGVILTHSTATIRRAFAEMDGSVDTRLGRLKQWRAMFRWAMGEGLINRDPTAGLKVEGRRKKGKPQLTIDESRRFVDRCLAESGSGDDSAVAVLLAFLLGLRAGEAAALDARAVDDGCSVVWVTESKTEAGVRRVDVPVVLRPLLERLTRNRVGRLFPDGDRYWVRRHCLRLCELAKVPPVSPHGLRGTHATLARSAGMSGHAVAATLGHESPAVTDAHYTAPGVSEQDTAHRALRVIEGGRR